MLKSFRIQPSLSLSLSMCVCVCVCVCVHALYITLPLAHLLGLNICVWTVHAENICDHPHYWGSVWTICVWLNKYAWYTYATSLVRRVCCLNWVHMLNICDWIELHLLSICFRVCAEINKKLWDYVSRENNFQPDYVSRENNFQPSKIKVNPSFFS